MGLFSNSKKPCPICGGATPRLLPTKVEGVPICKECDKKVDLPNGALNEMSLDDFRQYIAFYEKTRRCASASTPSTASASARSARRWCWM